MEILHKRLSKKLFSASITKFFEKVTIGKILTRYCEDMMICDNEIPITITPMVLITYLILGIIIIAVYVSYGLVLPLVAIYLWYVNKLSKLILN